LNTEEPLAVAHRLGFVFVDRERARINSLVTVHGHGLDDRVRICHSEKKFFDYALKWIDDRF
jgi:hypothetical protein